MLGLVSLLLLGLIVGWAVVVIYTAWMLTHPPRRGYSYAVARGLPGDPGELRLPHAPEGLRAASWPLRTADGLDLPVWDVPGADAAGPTIIITHGWGDSRVVMLQRLAALAPFASRLLIFDLRGHGEAPGACRLGTAEVDDLCRLIDAAGSSPVVLYGFSLGAGVSIAAAATLGPRVGAVIAEAPYRLAPTPARNMLELRGLPHRTTLVPALRLVRTFAAGSSLADTPFDRAAHAGRLHEHTRLLVLVGDHDEICPPEEARAIAAAGRGELRVITGAAHTDLWRLATTADQALEPITRLLRPLRASTQPSAPTSPATLHS